MERSPRSHPPAIYPSPPPAEAKAQRASQAWTPWQEVRREPGKGCGPSFDDGHVQSLNV